MERYEVQTITKPDGSFDNFRITDRTTDSRIATCYLIENAELVVDALNRVELTVRRKE